MIHILSHGEANGEDAKRNVPEIVHKLGEQRHRFWCGDAYLEYEIKVATGTAAWGVSASVTARQQLTQPPAVGCDGYASYGDTEVDARHGGGRETV